MQAITRDPLEGTSYRALGLLGQGQSGAVYLARDEHYGTEVVAKVLLARHVGATKSVTCWRLESETLDKLNHPNLVQVFDFGETKDGSPFIVMERLIGGTLAQELRRYPSRPLPQSLKDVWQVLSALHAMHREGMVHRDIKPSNVFAHRGVNDVRIIKVLDYGIVKVTDDPGCADRSRVDPGCADRSRADPGCADRSRADPGCADRSRVDPGCADRSRAPRASPLVIGTPRYMSPEQTCAQPVDARSDLYSTALLFYRLVAGRGPFDHHKNDDDVAFAQVGEIPKAPSAFAPEPLSVELDALILKGLEKDPGDRFQSAEEFAAALAAVQQSTS